MPFLQRVKPLWDRSTLTLADLAERCNISESSASRYLNGKIVPPADVAERIIQVLGGENSAADDTEVMNTEEDEQKMHQLIEHIREIYREQIATLQTNYAGQLSTLQANYTDRIADLQRDKKILFIAVAVLVAFQVYLMIDGFHGNWGIFQYPVN